MAPTDRLPRIPVRVDEATLLIDEHALRVPSRIPTRNLSSACLGSVPHRVSYGICDVGRGRFSGWRWSNRTMERTPHWRIGQVRHCEFAYDGTAWR